MCVCRMLGERGLGLVDHVPLGCVAKINIPWPWQWQWSQSRSQSQTIHFSNISRKGGPSGYYAYIHARVLQTGFFWSWLHDWGSMRSMRSMRGGFIFCHQGPSLKVETTYLCSPCSTELQLNRSSVCVWAQAQSSYYWVYDLSLAAPHHEIFFSAIHVHACHGISEAL